MMINSKQQQQQTLIIYTVYIYDFQEPKNDFCIWIHLESYSKTHTLAHIGADKPWHEATFLE